MPLSYTVLWKISGYQNGLLTCMTLSPSGARLVIGSEDQNLLLVDADVGKVLVELSFEEQFKALCAMWYAEHNAVVGCCNGGMYDVCFNPTNKERAVTMSPFLTPQSHQVRSLAYDPARCILAVGYGSTVALYMYGGSAAKWEPLEIIKAPCDNEGGLVQAMFFYPTDKSTRDLFIGHAEQGWHLWSDVSTVRRVSRDSNHNVCRIGRASLSSDEKSIVVSTLDHTIATYAIGSEGPILSSLKEYPYSDVDDFSPVVPVASTPDGLTLGGTTHGEVPMIGGTNGGMSLIRHEEPDHLIHAIVTHDRKIIVGSSSFQESVVKCYSSSAAAGSAVGESHHSAPIYVAMTEALAGWEPLDSRWDAVPRATLPRRWKFAIRRSVMAWLLVVSTLMVLILSADPPGGESFKKARPKESEGTDIFRPTFDCSEYWILFGLEYFCGYFKHQLTSWGWWVMDSVYQFWENVAEFFPEAKKALMLVIAKWMCERVDFYRKLGLCPDFNY
ncbi:hypothetical protein FRC12_002573 [Ceratobasidium sp. 428]|nr:hypothetical protein FRC12_002573 [Ceratobasidium sp. 428]